jgi:hypothetical protein
MKGGWLLVVGSDKFRVQTCSDGGKKRQEVSGKPARTRAVQAGSLLPLMLNYFYWSLIKKV